MLDLIVRHRPSPNGGSCPLSSHLPIEPMLHTRSFSSCAQYQQHTMEDFGACTTALSFSDALGLYAFDDTFDSLTAWPSLSELTSSVFMQVKADSKKRIPAAKVARQPQRRGSRAPKTRTRRGERGPAVKQPRKRAKTEILSLQGQVAELESLLTQLQSTAGESQCHEVAEAQQGESLSLAVEPSKWSLHAAEEHQKLKEAQELNALLKSALTGEVQVREAFEVELQAMNQLHAASVELLYETASMTSTDSQPDVDCTSSLSQIRGILVDLETLYSDAGLAIKEADEAPRETTQRFELLDIERTSWQHM